MNFEKLQEIKNKSLSFKAMPIKEEKLKFIFKIFNCFFKNEKIFFLEVGSGIGWSFLNFASNLNIKEAVLIEKSPQNFQELSKNISLLNELKKKIKISLINEDALTYLKNLNLKVENSLLKVAFIDANKSKYLDYYKLLRNFDVLIFDNSFYHLKVKDKKRNRTIIKNLNKFHETLLNENEKLIIHREVHDGLTIIINKKLLLNEQNP